MQGIIRVTRTTSKCYERGRSPTNPEEITSPRARREQGDAKKRPGLVLNTQKAAQLNHCEIFYFGEVQSHYRSPSQELSAKPESDIPLLHSGSLLALWGPRSPTLWHRHTMMADAGISLFYRWIPCVGPVQPSLTRLNQTETAASAPTPIQSRNFYRRRRKATKKARKTRRRKSATKGKCAKQRPFGEQEW